MPNKLDAASNKAYLRQRLSLFGDVKGKKPFIFALAAMDSSLDVDKVLPNNHSFSCADCGCVFLCNAEAPYCPNCGSDETVVMEVDKVTAGSADVYTREAVNLLEPSGKQIPTEFGPVGTNPNDKDAAHQYPEILLYPQTENNRVQYKLPDFSEFCSIACANEDCQAYTMVTEVTAKAADGVLACVCCGSTLEYEYMNAEEAAAKKSKKDDKLAGKEANQERFAKKDLLDAEEIEKQALPKPAKPVKGTKKKEPEVEVIIPAVNVEQEHELLDDEDACDNDTAMVAFAANVLAETGSPAISVFYDTYMKNIKAVSVVASNGVTVASVTKETFSQKARNPALWETQRLLRPAILATYAARGVTGLVDEFAMAEPTINVPLGAYIEKKVTANTVAQKEKIALEAQKRTKHFERCMSIASAGLIKNFWKNEGNPLKEVFFSELSHAGVYDSRKIIEHAFSAAGAPYHKALLERAATLANLTVEALSEVENAVIDTNDTISASVFDEDTVLSGITPEVPSVKASSQFPSSLKSKLSGTLSLHR